MLDHDAIFRDDLVKLVRIRRHPHRRGERPQRTLHCVEWSWSAKVAVKQYHAVFASLGFRDHFEVVKLNLALSRSQHALLERFKAMLSYGFLDVEADTEIAFDCVLDRGAALADLRPALRGAVSAEYVADHVCEEVRSGPSTLPSSSGQSQAYLCGAKGISSSCPENQRH